MAAGSELLHERWPDKTARDPKAPSTVPISEMMSRGEREEIIKKKIVYEYRPLYTLSFTICFVMLVWATAFTIQQISDNQTARACFAAGSEWKFTDSGGRECTKP